MRDPGYACQACLHHLLNVSPHERLAAWRRSYELVLKVYESTDTFPGHERFGLTSQTRRAAFSVVANIAEGSAKKGAREFRRYLDIALGSMTELQVALRLARDRAYLSPESWSELERMRNHAGILTWKLYRAVQNGRQDP
jgi:four helix bundle protein